MLEESIMNFNIFDKRFCDLLEKSNYQLLSPIYFTEVIAYTCATSVYSKYIEHPWYNHFYIHQDKIQCIKDFDKYIFLCNTYYSGKKRRNCIYIPEELEEQDINFQKYGYSIFEKECWWYFDSFSNFHVKLNESLEFSQISYTNYKDFIKVFNRCFSLKEIDAHSNCWKNAFKNMPPLRHIGFIAYQNFVPVGTLWLAANERTCGIYMVTTIPECRKQGIFSSLFVQAIQFCRLNKIQHIILQAVSSDKCNEIYKKMGFVNIFNRIGYLSDIR